MKAEPKQSRRTMCLAVAALLAGALSGCTTTTEVQTFVRDAYVDGPVFSPPVHVVTDRSRNAVTISAFAAAQQGATLRGKVDGPTTERWSAQPGPLSPPPGSEIPLEDTRAHTLFWYTPKYAGGMHLDVAWSAFAISLGGMLASNNGSTRFGWNAGIGFFSRETSAVRIRADIGLFGQSMDFIARTMTVTTYSDRGWGWSSRSVDTAYYFDRAFESGLGYYGSLTINTAQRQWPVNLFFQLHCVRQSLLSFTPRTMTTVDWLLFVPIETGYESGKVTTSATLLGITPGLYLEPSPSSVLVAGVRFAFDISETIQKPASVIIPFVQFGLRVGL